MTEYIEKRYLKSTDKFIWMDCKEINPKRGIEKMRKEKLVNWIKEMPIYKEHLVKSYGYTRADQIAADQALFFIKSLDEKKRSVYNEVKKEYQRKKRSKQKAMEKAAKEAKIKEIKNIL